MSEAKWQEVYKVQTAAITEMEQRIAELEAVIAEVRGHILIGNWPSGTTDKHKLHKIMTDVLIRKEIDK